MSSAPPSARSSPSADRSRWVAVRVSSVIALRMSPVRDGRSHPAAVHCPTMSSSSGMAAVPAADPPAPRPDTSQVEPAVPAGTTVPASAAPAESVQTAPARKAGRGSWLLDELVALSRPVVMPIFRRLPAVIFVLCALLTTICVATVLGAVRDDMAISRHPVVTTAEVLPGSSFSRTLIRFTTAEGKLLVPERGVYYPRGLHEGEFVVVQYDATHPDRVRVLGRNATVGLLPVALMLLGVWAVLLPLGWWLRGRRRRRAETSSAEVPPAGVPAA